MIGSSGVNSVRKTSRTILCIWRVASCLPVVTLSGGLGGGLNQTQTRHHFHKPIASLPADFKNFFSSRAAVACNFSARQMRPSVTPDASNQPKPACHRIATVFTPPTPNSVNMPYRISASRPPDYPTARWGPSCYDFALFIFMHV